MTFFDVVLAVCMLSDPSQCREQRIQYESYGSLQECVFEAQFYIAQWQASQPGWEIRNWRCEYAATTPEDAEESGRS